MNLKCTISKHPPIILTTIIFLILFSSKAAGENSNFNRLSHDQYAVTYSGAYKNDIVGVFDPWYCTKDTSAYAYNYSLLDSKGGTYAISSTSGVITILKAPIAGLDVLQVKVTLGKLSQVYKMYVTVKNVADCYFIDPSASSNGTGTRNSPFNSWSRAKFAAGKAYFQKRGTIFGSTVTVGASGTKGKEIYIGAYGTGKRPIITTNSTTTGMYCNGSFIRFFEFCFSGNKVGLYKGHGSSSAGYSKYTDLMFSDLTFYGNHTENGQMYLSLDFSASEWPTYETWKRVRAYDIDTYNSVKGYGIKVEGGNGARFENIKTHDNASQGMSVTWGTIADTIVGLLAYNNLGTAIELSGRNHSLSYSIIRAATGKSGITVDDPGSANSIIHHNLIEGGDYKGAIVLDAYSNESYITWPSTGTNFKIEDNVICGTTKAGIVIYYSISNVTIQRNKFHHNYIGVNIGVSNTNVKNIKILNNLFYEIGKSAIVGTGGTEISVYHNTIDGGIDLSGTSNETVRNNYLKSVTSAATNSNNLDMDTINKSRHFSNYSYKNFKLKSTAVSSINRGYSVGLAIDLDSEPRTNKPDIGAYEYYAGQLSSKPEPATPDSNYTSTANFIYIDPANKNDALEVGSLDHPFDSWNDIQWKEGVTYAQKRGTSTTVDKIIIGANKVTLDSYGSGELPVIKSETNTYLISGFEKSGVKIRNLNIQAENAISSIYFLGNSGDSIIVEKCILYANTNAVKVIDGNILVIKYNTIISMHEGIYSTAITNELYYNVFKNSNTAVNILSNNSTAKIYNNVFFNNDHSLSVSYASLTLYNNIFYMLSPDQSALNQGTGKLISNYNIYFPEQLGFIKVGNTLYTDLKQVQNDLNIDLNSFSADPLFVDIFQDNFGLKSGSPAINSGIDVKLMADISGNKIPMASFVDIGAYEYTGKLPDVKNEDDSKISVYPNPSTGMINFIAELMPQQFTEEIQPEVQVVDMLGKTVFYKKLNNLSNSIIQETIELSEVSNGVYILILHFAEQAIKSKIVIER